MKPNLLIIDDDEEIRSQMRWALNSHYEVRLAEDRGTALAAYRATRPALILLDLGLPPRPAAPDEGFAVLGEILAENPRAKVVVISGQNERANAIRAIDLGAHDFISKPLEIAELTIVLKRALHVSQLEEESVAKPPEPNEGFEGLIGTSAGMVSAFSVIRKVAVTDASVLILGESGTGKEMAAVAIHRQSKRSKGPFVAINCGAIPESLLESELFGHEKGAFTGAHATRVGRIETASGGTLFLDEIGELPALLQVKLLRFLQEQTIERVGGRKPIPIDVRVIAATHVNLPEAMAKGRFREDLYYRLAVVVLRLPSLREREGDVVLLAQTFLERFAREAGCPGIRFDAAAIRAIERHPWPGNVRELENRVRRGAIMAEGARITAADLELSQASGGEGRSLKGARQSVERELIVKALQRSGGNISAAAAEVGVSRPTFYELMEKLGIKRDPA